MSDDDEPIATKKKRCQYPPDNLIIKEAVTRATSFMLVAAARLRAELRAVLLEPIAQIAIEYSAFTNADRIAIHGIEIARSKGRELIASECGMTVAIYVRSLKSLRVPRNLPSYSHSLPVFKSELKDNFGHTFQVNFTGAALAQFMDSFGTEGEPLRCYKKLFGGSWEPRLAVLVSLKKQLINLQIASDPLCAQSV